MVSDVIHCRFISEIIQNSIFPMCYNFALVEESISKVSGILSDFNRYVSLRDIFEIKIADL